MFSSDDAHSFTRSPLHRYAHDVSMSSLDDPLPIHLPSVPSTPTTTSPSTAYSSLIPGSLSSATSESVSMPSADPKSRSEFGLLTPASPSLILGSASSRQSADVPPRKFPSNLSQRPSTAPHSPSVHSVPVPNNDNLPPDRHSRSHSRLTITIKNLLSRPAIASPSRFSFKSVPPPESDPLFSPLSLPATSSKWPISTPRKSRTVTDLEISDAHRRYAGEAVATGPSSTTVDVSSSNVPPPPLPATRGREPRQRNVLRRRPSGSAKLIKGRNRDMSSPCRQQESDLRSSHKPQPSSSSLLTPASAVAEAYKYKQQELGWHAPIDDQMSSNTSHDPSDPCRPPPHYTVFGSSPSSSSPQVASTDARQISYKFDAEDDESIWATPRATPPTYQPSILSNDSVGRSLTHKVSSRWRRLDKGVEEPSSPLSGRASGARSHSHSKGRPSLQEMMMWGDRMSMRSMAPSMDVVSPTDGAWASPCSPAPPGNHARSGSDKSNNTDGSAGSNGSREGSGGKLKLWRLMRRISTGALRDRFQGAAVGSGGPIPAATSACVPPVPAIPKELLDKVPPPRRSYQRKDQTHARTLTSPRNISSISSTATARPSVATTSSLNSSDLGSSPFFSKTHSARSSVSSYGDALGVSPPPASRAPVDQHIIAPLEQLRLGEEQDQRARSSCSPRRSPSVPACLRNDELGPLPGNPRRQTCSGESPLRGSSPRPSSSSASPSTSAYISAYGGSPHASISVSISGSPHTSYYAQPQPQTPTCGRSRLSDGVASLSPPPPQTRSSRRGESITTLTTRKQQQHFTFRELDTSRRRPPLSEQEKADIWDDLLARSDRAGGTLHIKGGVTGELLSDRDSLRFSACSSEV